MNRKTSGRAALLTAALLLLGPVAQAAAGSASPAQGGISLRPAHLNAAHPLAYFTYHLAPGRSVGGTVLVTNTAFKAVKLLVSPVDGLTGATTGSVYANRGVSPSKAGAWVSVSASTIVMGPRSTQRVPFTVNVPPGASIGDHLAGIAFENANPTTSTSGFRIREIVRDVIGVLVVVPGPAVFHPRLVSLGIHAIGSTGIGSVLIGLGNNGKALAKPVLTVILTGPGGYHRTSRRQLDTVLPGDTVVYPDAWPDRLVKGTYTIVADLTGGGVTATLRRTVSVDKTLAAAGGPVATTKIVNRSNTAWLLLIAVLAALVVLLVMVGMFLRRHRPPSGGHPVAPAPGAGSQPAKASDQETPLIGTG